MINFLNQILIYYGYGDKLIEVNEEKFNYLSQD